MAKIHNFKQDDKVFYKLALENEKNGDYGKAIECILSAIKISEKKSYLFTLGKLYAEVSAYKASNRIYFSLFAKENSILCATEIIRNKLRMKNGEDAMNFAKTVLADVSKTSKHPERFLEKVFEIPEFEALIEIASEESGAPALSYYDKKARKQSKILLGALDYGMRGKYAKAIELAESVEKDGEDYLAALEIIAVAAASDNRIELTKSAVKKIFDGNPCSFFAYKMSTHLGFMADGSEPFDLDAATYGYINRALKEGKIEELRDVYFYFEKTKYEFQVAEAIYSLNPLEYEGIYNLARLYFYNGMTDEFVKMSAELVGLYPYEPQSLLFNRIVKEGLTGKAKKIDSVNNILKRKLNSEIKRELRTGKLTERAKEALAIGLLTDGLDDDLEYLLRVALDWNTDGLKEYLLTALCDESITPIMKINLLDLLLFIDTDGKILFVYDGELLYLEIEKLNPSMQYFDDMKIMYANIILSTIEAGNNPDTKILKGIIEEFSEYPLKLDVYSGFSATEAVIFYYYNQKCDFKMSKALIAEICGVSVQTMNKYLKIYPNL